MSGEAMPFMYCIAYSGTLKKTLIYFLQRNIENGIVINPLLERTEKHNGKWGKKLISLTPGYLFLYANNKLSVSCVRQINKVCRLLYYSKLIAEDEENVHMRSYELIGEDKDFATWLLNNHGVVRASTAYIDESSKFHVLDGPLKDCIQDIKRIDKHNRKALVSYSLNSKPLDMWLSFEWVQKGKR